MRQRRGDWPVFACDAYVGTFHRLCRAYAEMFHPRWVVLSAKHEFLLPEDTVPGPYDLSFSHKSDDIISMKCLAEQVRGIRLNESQHLVVLTGKKYKLIVEKSFGPRHRDSERSIAPGHGNLAC
ncbi:DUF6884 domain-containing protein [Salicibibacter cibi]|uniref:DUF6884 domain-containing protein n=1 Tax=Salicibibacter cibi TaxID=2743001 RepID=UPI003CCE3AD1